MGGGGGGARWGVDTSFKLSPQQARNLAAASVTVAGQDHPVTFVFRYIPLPGNDARGDIDAAEAQGILDAGLTLLLVQHCRAGRWIASQGQGALDGDTAARAATKAGYAPGACLGLDLEALANVGAPVAQHCEAWGASVIDAGFLPFLYVGFDAGLTPQQLYDMRNFTRYMSDAGPRSVVTRGFCCKQFAQTTLCGIPVDPDHAFPDVLGGVLVGTSAQAVAMAS